MACKTRVRNWFRNPFGWQLFEFQTPDFHNRHGRYGRRMKISSEMKEPNIKSSWLMEAKRRRPSVGGSLPQYSGWETGRVEIHQISEIESLTNKFFCLFVCLFLFWIGLDRFGSVWIGLNRVGHMCRLGWTDGRGYLIFLPRLIMWN